MTPDRTAQVCVRGMFGTLILALVALWIWCGCPVPVLP